MHLTAAPPHAGSLSKYRSPGGPVPARMRASGLGWALGIGRLGGIAWPALGGYLLALGLRPSTIFLSAWGLMLSPRSRQRCCGFAASASRASRQRRSRHEGLCFRSVANLDRLKDGGPELPYPLATRHFDEAGSKLRPFLRGPRDAMGRATRTWQLRRCM
jgi:hypothetical protein